MNPQDIPTGTDHNLGRLMSVIHRMGQAYAASALHDRGIGPGQASVLQELLRKDDVTQEELASALRIDKGNIARRLAALETGGMVRRRRGDNDRRIKLVALTAEGRKTAQELEHVVATWTNALTRGFSEQERELLPTLLQRMAINAERLLRGAD